MKIFNYTQAGVFTGATEINRKPGLGLPALSTKVEPPEFAEGEQAVFDAEKETWLVEMIPQPAEVEVTPESLKREVVWACDKKQDEVGQMLLGEKFTLGQIKRYELKYDSAKKGEFSDAENAAIIVAHEAYLALFKEKINLIEMARHGISRVIETGDLIRAESLLDTVKEFGADTTKESLVTLFAG